MSSLLNNLLVFGRLLRSLGLDVHVGRLLDVAEALSLVELGDRDEVYHTCRTFLVHRHEDLAIFDRAFDAFWRDRGGRVVVLKPAGPVDSRELDPSAHQASPHEAASSIVAEPYPPDTDDSPPIRLMGVWSDTTGLADKDFAEFTSDEIALARAALDRLTWNPGDRRTRRWIRGRGPRIDLRRALARSLRTHGEVVTLPRLRRRVRPRPLVVVCDVSGSMERYSRMLLYFAHAIARRHRRVEAFLFSTTLTRITQQLRNRNVDDAVAAVSRSVSDWSGGTKIGDALKELHQRWARRALHGNAVVLLVSDGWDRGEPSLLREQVARLQRSCYRLIWLNPLIGTIDYAPLTRGLQASLPFVDDFLPARTLTNLADLAIHLNSLTRSRWN